MRKAGSGYFVGVFSTETSAQKLYKTGPSRSAMHHAWCVKSRYGTSQRRSINQSPQMNAILSASCMNETRAAAAVAAAHNDDDDDADVASMATGRPRCDSRS